MKVMPFAATLAVVAISGALFRARPRFSAAAPTSPSSYVSSVDASSLRQQIVSKEREGLEALKAGNVERFGDLTADEAVMVDDHGPATKSQVLKNVAGFTLTDYSMEDVRFVPISPNSGLISYKITEKGVSHGRDFTAQVYVSSVWTERGDKWLCLFSQETTARQQNK
jgi:Domain of unknown function (DUF4440)